MFFLNLLSGVFFFMGINLVINNWFISIIATIIICGAPFLRIPFATVVYLPALQLMFLGDLTWHSYAYMAAEASIIAASFFAAKTGMRV